MTRLRRTVGRIGETITLTTRFYVNGALFDPYAISSVEVYSAETGGTLLATLAAPVRVSVGVYQTTWSIPTNYSPGTYYDRWTWQAQSDMGTQLRIYSFRVDSAPPITKPDEAPLFVTTQEIDFFNGIAKELIQHIVGQKVIYYSISEELTKTDDLYQEAVRKTVLRPVEINALILFDTPVQKNTNFGIDTYFRIEIYFHKHELTKERNIIPREGDFVKFGEVLYEIEQLTEPQIVFGQIKNKVMTKAICRMSRESQFDIEE